MTQPTSTPVASQVANPMKAVARTAAAVALAAVPTLAILIAVLSAFTESYGDMFPQIMGWATAAVAFLTVTSAFLTRVMAVPGVNDFLGKLKLDAQPAEVSEPIAASENVTPFTMPEAPKTPKHRKEG